jgi:hypothetical protein
MVYFCEDCRVKRSDNGSDEGTEVGCLIEDSAET